MLLLLAIGLNLAILLGGLSQINSPGDLSGFDPVQPILFSHRLHSGEMLISCDYCHTGARTERLAGLPSATVCMNCHRFVQATLGAIREEERLSKAENRPAQPIYSAEIEKIYGALGINFRQQPAGTPERIRWIRIHRLPDFATFHHGVHAVSGIECTQCHGAVEKMERVRQTESLSMGWCVDCHRQYSGRPVVDRVLRPTTDCGGCHY